MNEETDLGPKPVPILNVFLRALGGLGGGVIGTGIILAIAFLGASVLSSALGESIDGTVHPLFVFVFIAMIFLGSTAANLLGPLFIGLTDRDKYSRLNTTLYQVFIANLVILIVTAPVYMIVSSLKVESIASVAALQVVVSAFVSALILEVIADYRYALLGVYSTALSVLVSAGVFFFFYSVSSGQPIILLFLALPTIWLSIGLFSGLLGLVYGWIYKMYGVDFLSSAIKYGGDQKWTSDEEDAEMEESREKAKDDAGAKFLDGQEGQKSQEPPPAPQASPEQTSPGVEEAQPTPDEQPDQPDQAE